MLKPIKLGAALPTFSPGCDRFVPGGYGEPRTVEQMFKTAARIEGFEGTELVSTWHVNDQTVQEVKALSEETGIKVMDIVVDLFVDKKWKQGSITSRDSKVRQEAIDECKKTLDWANELDCPLIDVWPGQDGFDYPFTADYLGQWDLLVDSLKQICDHQDRVRIGIEPKIKEPRKHIFSGTIGKTLHLINEVKHPLLGIIVDVGHALCAYENMAMSVCLAHRNDSLFHIHLNDNHRFWDDDFYPASLHTIEYLELLYWLERINYDGYYSLDINPYREDPVGIVEESFAWIRGLRNVLDKVGWDAIDAQVKQGDHLGAVSMIRQVMLG